ncbi:type II CAAX prenyl endopeptidase Rce1 family protein [Sneathiella sp.]|uniref:CPBP family glutamic-type intramembrane protease n=1 Tax=Sneathiella sp. TaxID=1964365 RepID=UPI00356480A6
MQVLKSRHNIWVFLLCVVGTQAVFVYGVANGYLSVDHYPMGRFYILFILATIYTVLDRGIGGIWDLIRPMLVWRVSIWWYVFAITWLTVFALAILFVKNLINGNGIVAIPLTFTMLNNFPLLKGIFLASIIEEIVWIGLILTVLQKRFTPLVSSQILGVFWYLWWVPVILYGQAVVPGVPVSILWLHYLGIAATCAWVYYFTKSGLVVALMQMLTNSVSLIVPILPHLSDVPTYITFIIGKLLFAILLFAMFGPKPLFGKTAKVAC